MLAHGPLLYSKQITEGAIAVQQGMQETDDHQDHLSPTYYISTTAPREQIIMMSFEMKLARNLLFIKMTIIQQFLFNS